MMKQRIWKRHEHRENRARRKADNIRRNYGPRTFFGRLVAGGMHYPHGNDRRRMIRRAGRCAPG